MNHYRIMKPRPAGSIYDAITRAVGQIEGGLTAAAEIIDRPRSALHAAGDPDTPQRKRVKLTYAEACALAGAGGVALAEHIALKAGGVFLPVDATSVACIHAGAAAFSREAGEAVCEVIQRASDGTFCAKDREAALPQIDDAIRALLALRAACEGKA